MHHVGFEKKKKSIMCSHMCIITFMKVNVANGCLDLLHYSNLMCSGICVVNWRKLQILATWIVSHSPYPQQIQHNLCVVHISNPTFLVSHAPCVQPFHGCVRYCTIF